MSCRPWEEPTPESEPPHPVTPTKPSRNDGASHADSDAEDPDPRSDEEEESGATKIWPPRHVEATSVLLLLFYVIIIFDVL